MPRDEWSMILDMPDHQISCECCEFELFDFREAFQEQVNKATSRFTDGTADCRTPDLSTLPIENVELVALNVAISYKHEEADGPRAISPDLLKFRRVGRVFANIGLVLFVKMAKLNGNERYRVLDLPPGYQTLTDLDLIFSCSTMLAQVVTNVVYHVIAGDSDEPQEYGMEYIANSDEFEAEDETEEIFAMNMKTWEIQTYKQEVFAHNLYKSKARSVLANILRNLPNLKHVKIEVKDFWKGSSQLTWASEDYDIGKDAYMQGVPAVLSALPHTGASTLELHGFGAFTCAGLSPSRVATLSASGYDAFDRITYLDISVAHRDDTDDDWEGGVLRDHFTSLTRADRLNSLLLHAPNLTRLSLICAEDQKCSRRGESAWLRDALQGHHWCKLSSLKLAGFDPLDSVMERILKTHKRSLTELILNDVQVPAHQWPDLLRFMRRDLGLQSAVIDLTYYVNRSSRTSSIDELDTMIASYGSGEDRSDLGAYVVKSMI